MGNNMIAHLSPTARLPYNAPHLVLYGAVRDLTAAGSMSILEGFMMTAPNRKS